MDPKIEASILKYLCAVNVVEEGVQTTLSLKDCSIFAHILNHLDESYRERLQKLEHCSHREMLNHIKIFLEEYYTNTADVINFDVAASTNQHEEELVKLELVKIAVALLCIGILDKNRHIFIEAALELETDVQEDILAIFKSVLAPDTGEMALTSDLELVLKGISGRRCETPVANLFQNLSTGDVSASGSNSRICTPQSQHMKSNASLLNTSYSDISSPFKGLEITVSSPSSFVDFIQSPQFVQKAVLKQKDTELRQVRQQLNTEIILKEEHRLNAEELLAANQQKDTNIERLQQRITELLAEKESETTVNEMSLKLGEKEAEVAMFKEKVSSLQQYKLQCHSLETENKSLTEDLEKLQKEVSTLRCEHHAQKESLTYLDHVTMQLEDKTGQLAELTDAVDKLQQDKALLKLDLEVLRERLVAAKQTVAELENRLENHEAHEEGETMSVVLDIQGKELKKQLEELRSERDALLQQLETANAEVAAQEKQVTQKECLWTKAREANSTLSRTLSLERDTVVKMKSRMETYVQRCQDLNSKLDTVNLQKTQNEQELETLRSELKDTQTLLQACQDDLARLRSLPEKARKSTFENSHFESSMSVSNLWQSCVLSESNTQTSKLLMRVNSAPALPRQNSSTVSLQSVTSMIEQHSALLPNAMSCAAEPDSPGCQWDTLSRLTGKSDGCDEKTNKRKGLSTFPENGADLKSQSREIPAKQRKKGGGTTLYFPLDPNGPVYPPAKSSDQFRLTSRQMVSPPHRSDLRSREKFSSSSVLAMSVDPSLTSPIKRTQSVKVSKYTPAKRGGRKFHIRPDTRPAFLNLKK